MSLDQLDVLPFLLSAGAAILVFLAGRWLAAGRARRCATC